MSKTMVILTKDSFLNKISNEIVGIDRDTVQHINNVVDKLSKLNVHIHYFFNKSKSNPYYGSLYIECFYKNIIIKLYFSVSLEESGMFYCNDIINDISFKYEKYVERKYVSNHLFIKMIDEIINRLKFGNFV